MSSHYNKNADEKRKTRAARRINNEALRAYAGYAYCQDDLNKMEEDYIEDCLDIDEQELDPIDKAWAMYDAEKAQKDAEAARIKEEQEDAMFAELATEKDAQANYEDENPEF